MTKPRVDYTSDHISKEDVLGVAHENYAAGLKEGARRERGAMVRFLDKDPWTEARVFRYWLKSRARKGKKP